MYQSGKTTTLWDYSLWAGERRTWGNPVQGCAQDVAQAVSMQPAGSSSLALFSCPYSPECVEGSLQDHLCATTCQTLLGTCVLKSRRGGRGAQSRANGTQNRGR